MKLVWAPRANNWYTIRQIIVGGISVCAGVVAAVVRLCEARAAWLRREAAAALYLLMRANFQHGSRGNLTRVHLQVNITP